MKYIRLILVAVLLISIGCDSDSNEDNSPTITFRVNGEQFKVLTRSEMQDQLEVFSITYYDTVYEKTKNLRAFELRELLELGFEIELANHANSTFNFLALDGFEDSATGLQAIEQGGHVAFEDLDVDGSENWEPVATENNNDPAPFYVVWTNPEQVPDNSYPWPYQLFAIDLLQ